MKAQVNNDANGWNDLSNILWAESEPTDPTQIKGNYTHAELPPGLGYRLTVPISMANDYNGYIASYREYQRGDHYRKALTAWGPHSSDYMATRLVGMGGELNGGPTLPDEVGQEKVVADLALNDQRADKLGEIGETSVTAYEAALPDDGGSASVAPAAAGRRAVRRHVLQVERRLQLHRQPAREGAAPGGRRVDRLSRASPARSR